MGGDLKRSTIPRIVFFLRMKISLIALVFAVGLPALAADTPSKRGLGFFGFGAPPTDQISGSLFPQEGPTAAPPAATSSSDGIFRSGQPQKVEPTSYVIENGQRIERPIPASMKKKDPPAPIQPLSTPAKPVIATPTASNLPAAVPLEEPPSSPKKHGSWFGFGKRGESSGAENPVLTAVPAAAPLLSATPVAREPKPTPKAERAPVSAKPITAKPAEVTQPSPVAQSTRSGETPDFARGKEEKGDKFGWIPFLGRKKDEEAPALALPLPTATPVPTQTVAASPGPAPKPTEKPAEKPATSQGTPSAKPDAKPAAGQVATFEIRRDESKPLEPEKKEKSGRDGGILTPITKIRPPKKEIDLTGAETIIANGQIVGETDTLANAVQSDTSAPRQAPQVVNGVKTYSSWNDVDARSSSAADKIISRIR